MKILLVSMPSIHVIRWIENLNHSNYELYWFDILSKGAIHSSGIQQCINWQKRKLPYIKGEFFLSKKIPFMYKIVQPFLEVTLAEEFERIIKEIQPDVVHSFEMQSCSYPLLSVMHKYPHVKWLYSCWGSDLFYYKNKKKHLKKIKNVLARVNFLHTDCKRDAELAKKLEFKGKHVGIIPGGGGIKLDELIAFKKPLNERKIILIKGYEHTFGKGLNVVKALELLIENIKNNQIIVFGAHQKVINFIIEKKLPFKFYSRHELSHNDLVKLMGKSLIYIGNSISDGMPNTLLEAITMNAFPIQSNPGGVTEELIEDGVNGRIINDPTNINSIKETIIRTLNKTDYNKAALINSILAKEKLEYKLNKEKIIETYKKIFKDY